MAIRRNDRTRGLGWKLAVVGLVLGLGLMAAPSCGGVATVGTDSSTHWLQRCSSGSECGELRCLCGVCTRACEVASGCSDLHSAASCSAVPSCGAPDSPSLVCVASCEADADCAAVGAKLTCEQGYCVRAASSRTDQPDAGNPFEASRQPDAAEQSDAAAAGDSASSADVDSAAPGVGACAALDATSNGDNCIEVAGYTFNGRFCERVVCGCAGSDCGRMFATVEACDRAYAECYAGLEVSRSCTSHADCVLATRTCCNPCGLVEADQYFAIQADAVMSYSLAVCSGRGPVSCPDCTNVHNRAVHAVCVEGQCETIDASEAAACSQDTDCRIATKDCCECNADTSQEGLIALSDYRGYTTARGCNEACNQCAARYPDVPVACDTDFGVCVIQDTP